MKRIILLAILLSLIFPVISFARNQIIYRPFNWQKLEWDNIILYYPKQMEELIPATMALIDSLNQVYSQEIFSNYKDYLELYQRYAEYYKKKNKTFENKNKQIEREVDKFRKSLAEEPDTLPLPPKDSSWTPNIVASWRPKKILILIYPSLQDFKQEKVIDAIIPPGLLGFMEILGYRVCVPYSGNWYSFSATLAHEIGHAWNHIYMKECEAIRNKILRQTNFEEMRYVMPLWFIEGWAQFSSYTYQGNNYEYLRCLLEQFTRQDVTSLTQGFKVLDQMEFEVYYNGANFLCWMAKRFGNHKLIELQQHIVYFSNFYRAWEWVFKEKLEESQRKWFQYLKDKYYITIYADTLASKDSSRIKSIPLPGRIVGYADYDGSRWIYYTKDSKWDLKVVVTDSAQRTIKLYRQFQNQSLWLRSDNRPTIKGNLCAFVDNREGQDELIVYQLSKSSSKKFRSKKIAVLRHKEIISIENPRLINSSQIVFEGIALNGYSDLYIWDFIRDKITRLTNDFYSDRWPTLFSNKILFTSDRLTQHSTGLYQIDLQTKEITEIFAQEHTYVDQICANDSLVAFRVVTFEHSPRVYVWSPKDGKIYQVYSTFYGASQIVNFKDNSLIIIAAEGDAKAISLDELAKSKKRFTCQPKKISAYTWLLPHPDYSIDQYRKKMDRRLRYGMVDNSNQFYISDITGERRLSFDGQAGYISGSPFIYYGWVSYQNLSRRLHRVYTFSTYQYYFLYYNQKYCAPNGKFERDLITRDWVPARITYGLYYPINLESGVGLSINPGYLRRIYLRQNDWTGRWHPFAQFSTPTLGTTVYFEKDAVFWGWWGQRQGTYLLAGVYTQFGKIDSDFKAIEGYGLIDFRYYFQFGGSRVYLANRFFALKAIGFDQYIYQLDYLYRHPPGYDSISGVYWDYGTNAVLLQSELRFPLLNFVAVQPAIFPPNQPKGILAFGVDASLFWYGGDVWFDKIDRLRWLNRAGVAIKIKLDYAISLKFENYKYIYSKKDLNFSNRKWAIALEYDF